MTKEKIKKDYKKKYSYNFICDNIDKTNKFLKKLNLV